MDEDARVRLYRLRIERFTGVRLWRESVEASCSGHLAARRGPGRRLVGQIEAWDPLRRLALRAGRSC